jgi:hypothetical protein
MFENYSLEEKIEAFENALKSMDFKPSFENLIRTTVLNIVSVINDLKPINIERGTRHNTMLTQYQSEELAQRFVEYLTMKKHRTSVERMSSRKLNESDIRRIVSKVLNK